MNEKIQLYTYQMVKEISNNIDSNLTIYNRLTMQIYANREIIENMKKSHRDFNEQFEIENSIRATLRSLINTDRYITSAYLVTTDGVKYVDGIEFPGLEEKFLEYQRLAREADGRVVWVPSNKLKNYYGKDTYIFGALREIKSSDGTRVGMLILLIREEFFEDIYRDIYFAENARRFIITKDCAIASSINKHEIGRQTRDHFFKRLALTEDGALIEHADFMVYRHIEQIDKMSALEKWLRFLFLEIDSKISEKAGGGPQIAKIKEYIRDHYHENLNLKHISEIFHLNTNYFCQLFKKETGVNFVDYLTEIRVDKAKILLKSSDFSTGEIAERVGFKNTNYFSKVFKKVTGCSISEYKKSLKQLTTS